MRSSDQQEPTVSHFHRNGKRCTKYFFPEGEHVLREPIELDDFDIIEGACAQSTCIKVEGAFAGPVIRSKRLKTCCEGALWLHEEGVPVRFSIKNITIDFSGWTPEEDSFDFDHGNLARCGIGVFGKAFVIENVTLMNVPGSGMISIGSNRGGKKDYYLDSPEAKIIGLEITNTKDDGLVFAGPHDSLLDDIIVSISKHKGVYIVADKKVNGACDIGFIHAYATNSFAIDVQAKIKARFLQGDTGRGGGVVIGGSNKSVIDIVEAYKTREARDGTPAYSIHVSAIESQIGLMRIRADGGADGLYLGGSGNVIGNLHVVAGTRHSGGKMLEKQSPPVPIALDGHANTIVYGRIVEARSEVLKVLKETEERHFTANLSVDFSDFDQAEQAYCANQFGNSMITINNNAERLP